MWHSSNVSLKVSKLLRNIVNSINMHMNIFSLLYFLIQKLLKNFCQPLCQTLCVYIHANALQLTHYKIYEIFQHSLPLFESGIHLIPYTLYHPIYKHYTRDIVSTSMWVMQFIHFKCICKRDYMHSAHT